MNFFQSSEILSLLSDEGTSGRCLDFGEPGKRSPDRAADLVALLRLAGEAEVPILAPGWRERGSGSRAGAS